MQIFRVAGANSVICRLLRTRGSINWRFSSLQGNSYINHCARRSSSEGSRTVEEDMAQQMGKFAYTVVYVKDVAKSIDFYKKAFGVNIRRLDNSHRWGELESGETTVAFTPLKQRETEITGGVQVVELEAPRHNVELLFTFADVELAFKEAVAAGAVPVAEIEDKPWGQKVGYVRDIDGVLVGVGSFVKE